jgi:hypothetical protein
MAEAFNYPHVGEMVGGVAAGKGFTKTEIGGLIGMSQSNAIYLTKRPSIDVVLLHKIGTVLKYDFFKHFPIDEGKTVKEGPEALLNQRIAELEKQLAEQKSMNENLQKENGYLKEINDLLRKNVK